MSGRRCPAEFEPQSAIWLSWPHNEEDWPGKMDEVRRAYVEMVRQITAEVEVWLLIHDARVGADATRELEAGNIEMRKTPFITYIPTDRGWMRDIAPVYVDVGDVRDAITWTFNGWALYDNHKMDAKVSETTPACRCCALTPGEKAATMAEEGSPPYATTHGHPVEVTTET